MTLQESAELVFLALAVWREARSQSYLCKIAVAYSIMARVEKPSWWGKNILEVLFKKWQYSSLTDPKDVQLITWPLPGNAWDECLLVAKNVIDKVDPNPVPGADSYYDVSIPAPYWAKEELFVRQINKIKFYNTDGFGA